MVTHSAIDSSDESKILALCIDGGGTKGIYPASFIYNIEQVYDIKFAQYFDFFMGTSSGSIIASALALDIPIKNVISTLYQAASRIIQSQNRLVSLFMESYNKQILHDSLHELFGDILLQQIKKPLAIPVSNISSADDYIFRSYDSDDNVDIPQKKCKLVDILTAACSAPTYFAPHKIGDLLFSDGALWCNNPSRECIAEIINLYDLYDLRRIKLCSLGTGREPQFYQLSDYNKYWGMIKWGPKLINVILSLQTNSVHKIVKRLLSHRQYIRVNFEYNRPFDLLDLDMFKKCEVWAKINFDKYSRRTYQFITKDK